MTTKPKTRKAPAAEPVEPTAVPNEESHKLVDAMDALSFAKSYIEAVYMAAASLSPHERGPISAVADTASDKINDAISLLQEYQAAQGMGRGRTAEEAPRPLGG
jgi:hypothetical protein